MFDSTHPPLLVLPITEQQKSLFPTHEGYNLHPVDDHRSLVCYKSGWTLPLSVHQNKFISETPLLLVRNKGRVTSEGSSFLKGYAHEFVQADGSEPEYEFSDSIFSDMPDIKWSFVKKAVDAIWLQYGYKSQYFNDPSLGMEKLHYGKLLIFSFVIERDFAPRLDKNADNHELHDTLYRVADRQLLHEVWNVSDKNPHLFIANLLNENGLGVYRRAVETALSRAGA